MSVQDDHDEEWFPSEGHIFLCPSHCYCFSDKGMPHSVCTEVSLWRHTHSSTAKRYFNAWYSAWWLEKTSDPHLHRDSFFVKFKWHKANEAHSSASDMPIVQYTLGTLFYLQNKKLASIASFFFFLQWCRVYTQVTWGEVYTNILSFPLMPREKKYIYIVLCLSQWVSRQWKLGYTQQTDMS